MPEFTGSVAKHPARSAVMWYLALIVVGMLVLSLAVCRATTTVEPMHWLDALFTSTSAVCVTGLAVRPTSEFSLLGQMAILVLIQIGGIGIMTVTTFIMFSASGRADLRQKMTIAETLGGDPRADLRWVLSRVLMATFGFEAIGFVLLFARFLFSMSFGEALWQALFHSVSAFCNAGFSLNDNSLESYRGDVVVNVTITLLIILGGIGFPVMLDLTRNWHGRWRDRWARLHLHSKMMLVGSTFLLVVPAITFLVLEWDNTLADTPLWQRPIIAWFQSVTCRTAGFNTVPVSSLTNASLFIVIVLMIIGAGSCSTGGGAKVSTMMILATYAWHAFRGHQHMNIARRTIPPLAVQRAVATVMLFIVLAIGALTLLLFAEQSSVPHVKSQGVFLDALFEVFSALGTVGLSTGMTPHLSTFGRLIIIVLMFAGRLGPISVFAALARSQRKSPLQYPPEEPLIG